MDGIKVAKERGNSNFKAKYYNDAITCYEEALVQTKFRKSDIAKEESKLTEEEKSELPKQKLDLDDIHQALLNNLAMCYQKKGEMNESCFYNDQCLQINPDHIKCRYRKVVIHSHDKEFDEAKKVAQKLIQDDPQNGDFAELLK